jgi:hypothetical protein
MRGETIGLETASNQIPSSNLQFLFPNPTFWLRNRHSGLYERIILLATRGALRGYWRVTLRRDRNNGRDRARPSEPTRLMFRELDKTGDDSTRDRIEAFGTL